MLSTLQPEPFHQVGAVFYPLGRGLGRPTIAGGTAINRGLARPTETGVELAKAKKAKRMLAVRCAMPANYPIERRAVMQQSITKAMSGAMDVIGKGMPTFKTIPTDISFVDVAMSHNKLVLKV